MLTKTMSSDVFWAFYQLFDLGEYRTRRTNPFSIQSYSPNWMVELGVTMTYM